MTLLAYIAVLVLTLAGVAVMLQVVSIGDAAKYFGRGVMALALGVIAFCMLKNLLVRVILPGAVNGLAVLRSLLGWALIGAVVLAALVVLFRFVRKRFE